jgi:hypothetical protein
MGIMKYIAYSSVMAILFCVAAAAPVIAAETVTYQYDALARLITKSNIGSVNAGKKVTVCYDAAGNRKVYKVAANGTAAVCSTAVIVPPPSVTPPPPTVSPPVAPPPVAPPPPIKTPLFGCITVSGCSFRER